MNRRRLILVVLAVVVVGLIWAELSYFRFHTYFQRTVVQETLPLVPADGQEAQAVTVVSGSFREVDAVHKGSGTARIVEQDGTRYLRLENFEVTNGPDLFVYLSESKTPGNSLKSIGNYIDLGPLKGNAGNQTYVIPQQYSGHDTAIIWCQRFGVLFSYAVMQ